MNLKSYSLSLLDKLARHPYAVYSILFIIYVLLVLYRTEINPPLSIISPYRGAVNWSTATHLYLKYNNLTEVYKL